MTHKDFKVALPACDEISLTLILDPSGVIQSGTLSGIGGPDLLELLIKWRPLLKGQLDAVPLPSGTSMAELLLKELLLKARGQDCPPYQEAELCHCRSVPTINVYFAILSGAHSSEKVSRWTSASTACGTCRKNVEALIDYYTRNV